MLYSNNDKDFEGVAFQQCFEGAAMINKRSSDYICSSLSQDQKKDLKRLSKKSFEYYFKNNLCLAATCNKVSAKHKIAQLVVHLASDNAWNIGIYCFQELDLDINKSAVIKRTLTHKKAHNHGIMTKMLWFLECFLREHGKQHLLVSLSPDNIPAIKCFLNAGYVIRALDFHDSKTYLVLYKHVDWSKGVNFYLGNDGHYLKMQDRNYIVGKISTCHITKQFEVNNIKQLAKLLQEGYYPTDIINSNYVCHQVASLPVLKSAKMQEFSDAT